MGVTIGPDGSVSLVPRLKSVLQELHDHRYPHVPNPPLCKNRAAVALVLRITPTFPQRGTWDPQTIAPESAPFQQRLTNFFDQDWVQKGDPEILFIKRAARTGDRWTGHTALPGGKREPSDADDQAASCRETREEVGLELVANHCLFIGNLPERVITTNWGKVPIMVLCPFVYLLVRHDIPPLALQPSEVHSTHWVSIRGLLSPILRSSERCDVSDRLQQQRGPFVKSLIRAVTGQLVFSATTLTPSESLYCSSAPGFIPTSEIRKDLVSSVAESIGLDSLWQKQRPTGGGPILLWGLTLGVVADLLHQIDARNTSILWSWPTFSHWDIRSILWILTYRLRANKLRQFNRPDSEDDKNPDLEIDGIDDTTFATSPKYQNQGMQSSLASAHLLDEYFGDMRRAVVYAFILRTNVSILLAAFLGFRYRRWRS